MHSSFQAETGDKVRKRALGAATLGPAGRTAADQTEVLSVKHGSTQARNWNSIHISHMGVKTPTS